MTKAWLAIALGPIAVAGAFVLKNPDGDHFLGKLRDSLRVARALDQVEILVKIVRKLIVQIPPGSRNNLMAELIEKQIVPNSMVRNTNEGVVVLSPWSTTITTANENRGFGITVPTSQLGCVKILMSSSGSGVYAISVNGQRLKLPIKDNDATKSCVSGKSIPDVTFWFHADVDGKS